MYVISTYLKMFINWGEAIIVSTCMASDCMTLGAADGMEEPDMPAKKAFWIAFTFGLFQGVMPILGYFAGYPFKGDIAEFVPWISFIIIMFLSIKSFMRWIRDRNKRTLKESHDPLSLKDLILQDIASSIDALWHGFVYLKYSIPQAMTVFAIIAVITFVLSYLSIIFGEKIGLFLHKKSGLMVGVVFLISALKILLQDIL